jgi:hypothetical protein
MGKQYRDEIAMVCHDMMKSAQSAGAVSDAEMEEFEADCFIKEGETAYPTEKPLKKDRTTHITA